MRIEYHLKAKQPRSQWANYLRKKYKMTTAQYDEKLAAQENKCDLCAKTFDGGKIEIDHCHLTGKVRGLLCARCNRWLAAIEYPKFLEMAQAYLGRHNR